MPVVGAGVREVVDPGPLRAVRVSRRIRDLDDEVAGDDRRLTSVKVWPGTPSAGPSTSSVTVSACTAPTVAPIVNAVIRRTTGGAM